MHVSESSRQSKGGGLASSVGTSITDDNDFRDASEKIGFGVNLTRSVHHSSRDLVGLQDDGTQVGDEVKHVRRQQCHMPGDFRCIGVKTRGMIHREFKDRNLVDCVFVYKMIAGAVFVSEEVLSAQGSWFAGEGGEQYAQSKK